jgi:stage V sporulation protein B
MLSLGGASQSQSLAAYGKLHSMSLPIIMYPMAAVSAFASLLVPEFAESAAKGDKRRMSEMAGRAIKNALVFSIGCAGVLIAFSSELGTAIYSSREVGRYIAMLAPLVPVMYLDHTVDAMLKGMGKQVFSMVVNITDSILSIILVCILLPKMGADGYVYVIVIAEIFNFSLSLTGLSNSIEISFDLLSSLLFPVLCVFISVGACRLFLPSAPLVLKILLCASFYVLLIFAIGKKLPKKAIRAKPIKQC